MSYPFFPPFKSLMLTADTSSTGGRPLNVTVPQRCKYLSTLFSVSSETTAGGTSAIDIFFYPGALNSTGALTAQTITSGFSISTTTGTYSTIYNTTATVFMNQGDILVVQGSTGIGAYNATHYLQGF